MTTIPALVLSGSAALYPAHLGACQALYETVFKAYRPRALVGTSGGALIAAFLATGQRPKEGLQLLKRSLPVKYIRPNWAGLWDRLTFKKRPRLGKFSLAGIEECLARHVPKQFCSAQIPLYITASDLVRGELVVFSQGVTPTTSVPWAARVSASMPGIFALEIDGDRALTDGGLLNNYPVDIIDGPSVGIVLRGQDEKSEAPAFPSNTLDLAMACVSAMQRGLQREHIEDAPWAHTLVVDVPWHALNFIGLNEEAVDYLYDAGYRSALAGLDAMDLSGL